MLGKVTGMIRGMENLFNRSLCLKLLFHENINAKARQVAVDIAVNCYETLL